MSIHARSKAAAHGHAVGPLHVDNGEPVGARGAGERMAVGTGFHGLSVASSGMEAAISLRAKEPPRK
ncbi:hypothetical protein [Streptomyces sp. NPDC002602]|uniref:hypothetical protein n=1 Tax=Streptomyces sp. NPDC002602 TaxID=3364654 RepID=UPI0036BD2660